MTSKITFELDGQSVSADAGETIWQVAKREGTRIPHLCHLDMPGYRPDGNCRACMVEIEGERVLAASCIRKPAEGMVVQAPPPSARRSRARWCSSCWPPTCGRARKRRTTSRPSGTGRPPWAMAGSDRFRRNSPTARRATAEFDVTNPAIAVNLDACIACGPACAPAARCRSTTSSAWPSAATTPCRSSTSTTRWACRPASPAANASRPARPARSTRSR